jgi:hypothetical protein
MTERRGIVLRAQSGRYAILDDAGILNCRARRRLERPDATWPEFPVAGDEVGWRLLSGAAHIVKASSRRFIRATARLRTRFGAKHVEVANLDRLVRRHGGA